VRSAVKAACDLRKAWKHWKNRNFSGERSRYPCWI